MKTGSETIEQFDIQDTAKLAIQLLKDFGVEWDRMNSSDKWLFKKAFCQLCLEESQNCETNATALTAKFILRAAGVSWDHLTNPERGNFKNLVMFILLAEKI